MSRIFDLLQMTDDEIEIHYPHIIEEVNSPVCGFEDSDLLIKCPCCGKEQWVLQVSKDGLDAWEHGELIQNALPDLNASEREALISGLCTDCQKEIFGV